MSGATLLPVLVRIQSRPDANLGLAALACLTGLSARRFHDRFTTAVGETPKAYTLRIRLERAAFWLLVQDATLLDIALECGFRSHETFTRAFVRHFGRTPRAYREWIRGQMLQGPLPPSRASAPPPGAEALSRTRVMRMRELDLAFIRHVGPYEDVPLPIFAELHEWATRTAVPGPRVWLGLGHDAPAITPAHLRRFDAAIVVPAPFASDGRVAHQRLPAGEFAVTTYVGAYDRLPEAYAEITPRALALPGHELVGLPAVEIYHDVPATGRRVPHVDICLPLRPRRAPRRSPRRRRQAL
jgi:AraC family transcriptional regulator